MFGEACDRNAMDIDDMTISLDNLLTAIHFDANFIVHIHNLTQYDNAHTYQYKNMLIHDLTNLIKEIAILIINMKQPIIAWINDRSNSSRLSFGFNIIMIMDKPLLKQLYKIL